jgi:hypothetical protein
MTLHDSWSRLASILRSAAPVAIIACSLGAQASAAEVKTLLSMRPSRAFFSPTQMGAQNGIHPSVPIQAALDLLKWSPDRIPKIEVVDVRPPQVSPRAEGWTTHNSDGTARPTIYVAGWSALYRTVLANKLDVHFSVIRLAGVLAHERAHIEHGPGEELAYVEQLIALERLRAHDIDIDNVRRALDAVKRQQRGGHSSAAGGVR